MSEKKNVQNNTMPKSTAYIAIALAFFVGLFIGQTFLGGTSSQSAAIQKQVLNPNNSGSGQSMNVNNQLLAHIAEEEAKAANDPNNADIWGHLGNLYFDTDQYEKSIEAYQKSLALAPNNTNRMTDMGTMYRANGQFDKALETYDKVLALDPNHVNARLNRGVVLIYDLNRKEEGLNTWKILVQKFPDVKGPNGRPMTEFIKELEQN